jgi:hypothetical protein
MNATDPRYPIGKFEPKENYTKDDVLANIERIRTLPDRLEKAVHGFSTTQLDTPYREGGWTVRQVIHHMADSHMNAYIRFKWTLTENTPTIKAYLEKLWAETPETKANPGLSIALLKALHAKWEVLLMSLSVEDLHKQFIHPETKIQVPLDRLIALYAWHGEHHLAHITSLKVKMTG